MDELYADQQAGREPADPARLFSDPGVIKGKFPLDRFAGHSAWLDGSWKLHRIESKQDSSPRWELYDLAADPKEANDLAAKEPGRAAAMSAELEAWLKSVARSFNGEDY
jgi:hypothetical protein